MSPAAAPIGRVNPGHVSDRPPAPTAGTVLEQRAAKERELAALEAKVGEIAYLAATNGKSGAASLAELHGKILTARFELASSSAAHTFAIEADRAAVADWWTQVHALPPEDAIAGISETQCCDRCSEQHSCLITGAECGHPMKAGWNLNPRHQGNPAVRRLHKAAAQKLGVWR